MTLWTTSRRFFHLRAALCQNLTKFQFCDLQSPTSELSHISRLLSKGKKRPRSWTVTTGGTL